MLGIIKRIIVSTTHLIVVERFYLILNYAKINFASNLLSLKVILEIYPIYY